MCKDNVQKMDGNKLYDLLEGDWRFNDCARQNVLLLFLSDRKDKDKCSYNTYTAFNGKYYTGKNTNDAPVQTLIDQASKDGNVIDTVLCIVSKLVFMSRRGPESKRDPGDDNTDYEVFEEFIHKYCSKNGINIPAIIPVPYDFKVLKDGSYHTIEFESRQLEVYKHITSLINKESNIYMDSTGGFRDMNLMLTLLMQYMELHGIKCKDLVYSSFQDKKIIDLGSVYELNSIITGTNEYLHTGRAEQLLNFFKEKYKNYPKKELDIIIRIIQGLQNFAEMISVCNVTEMDEARRALQATLENAKEISNSGDLNISLFEMLYDNIRKGMHLESNDDSVIEYTYPMIIQWCLDRNLLQQALTIYIEKMPEYYYEKNRQNPFIPEGLLPTEESIDSSNNTVEVGKEFYSKTFEPIFEVRRKEFQSMFSNLLASEDCGNSISKEQAMNILNDSAWDGYREAKERIRSYISSSNDNGYLVQSDTCMHNTIKSFFNSIKERAQSYYTVIDINNKEDYELFKANTTKTYGKRMLACKAMKEKEGENSYLSKIMHIYLILKMVRNQVNHASEEFDSQAETEEDIGMVCAYFHWPDFSTILNYNFIKNTIQAGIDLEKIIIE